MTEEIKPHEQTSHVEGAAAREERLNSYLVGAEVRSDGSLDTSKAARALGETAMDIEKQFDKSDEEKLKRIQERREIKLGNYHGSNQELEDNLTFTVLKAKERMKEARQSGIEVDSNDQKIADATALQLDLFEGIDRIRSLDTETRLAEDNPDRIVRWGGKEYTAGRFIPAARELQRELDEQALIRKESNKN